jgi:hypothetical protein
VVTVAVFVTPLVNVYVVALGATATTSLFEADTKATGRAAIIDKARMTDSNRNFIHFILTAPN